MLNNRRQWEPTLFNDHDRHALLTGPRSETRIHAKPALVLVIAKCRQQSPYAFISPCNVVAKRGIFVMFQIPSIMDKRINRHVRFGWQTIRTTPTALTRIVNSLR